jgi:hypothetical protein
VHLVRPGYPRSWNLSQDQERSGTSDRGVPPFALEWSVVAGGGYHRTAWHGGPPSRLRKERQLSASAVSPGPGCDLEAVIHAGARPAGVIDDEVDDVGTWLEVVGVLGEGDGGGRESQRKLVIPISVRGGLMREEVVVEEYADRVVGHCLSVQ